MDPMTAFSLACGVIQVVNFSIKTAKICRELYRDGSLSENEDIEGMAKHLMDLRTGLSLPSQLALDNLLDLGTKCSDTGQALIVELQKLKVSGPHKKRQVLGKSVKAIWKKSTIEDIQKRLDDYRKILDSRVLVDLRSVYYDSPMFVLSAVPDKV